MILVCGRCDRGEEGGGSILYLVGACVVTRPAILKGVVLGYGLGELNSRAGIPIREGFLLEET